MPLFWLGSQRRVIYHLPGFTKPCEMTLRRLSMVVVVRAVGEGLGLQYELKTAAFYLLKSEMVN